MISCTEFIPLYSELFKYLEERGGHDEVVKYWEYISDTYVADLLGKEVEGKGIRGCWDYWSKSLNEEACDFSIELDEEAGTFKIDMRYCPSRGRLNEFTHIEPYYDYCGHCTLLYNRQLKKYGIEFDEKSDLSRVDKAQCYWEYKIDPKFKPSCSGCEKLSMSRKASDNEYFHRDFHVSGARGLEYVGNNYGDEAVCEYLMRFAKAYYAPLAKKIKDNGLGALKEHIENIYATEKASENLKISLADNELRVSVSECPGVKYIRESGNDPTKWYIEETKTVNKAIAEMSGYEFELLSYDDETGAAEYRFTK